MKSSLRPLTKLSADDDKRIISRDKIHTLAHGHYSITIKYMNPENIPFNALISGPTNCGKTKYLLKLLSNEFRFKFDYIVLLYPTVCENETYSDENFLVITPGDDKIYSCFWFVFNVSKEQTL